MLKTCVDIAPLSRGSGNVKHHAVIIVVYLEVWVETRIFPIFLPIIHFHDAKIISSYISPNIKTKWAD